MYVGELHLSGIPEWHGIGPAGWQQSDVDARWAQIGAPPPAPLVPASLIGWSQFVTRGPRMVMRGNSKNTARRVTPEENDFWNYFLRVAADPFHEESIVSKIADGVIKVASVVVPTFSYLQAGAEAGNVGLAMSSQGAGDALAQRAMAPAFAAQAAEDTAKDDANFQAQIQKLQSLAPDAVPLALSTAPVASAAAPPKLSKTDTLAIGAAVLLLLGVALA